MGDEQLNERDFLATLDDRFDVNPRQGRFVSNLLGLYRERRLISTDGHALPLHASCPRCGICWRGGAGLESSNPESQRVSVPWVGREYEESGVLIVGMNLHDYGGLAAHWWVCHGYARDQREGKRGKGRLTFGYGAALYAHAVLHYIDGRPLSHDPLPKPEELAYTWDRCAFTEAIKCAPTSPRSQPLDPMFKQCPDFLLTDELQLLKPGVVLLLGRSRLRDEVRPLFRERFNLEWGDHTGGSSGVKAGRNLGR